MDKYEFNYFEEIMKACGYSFDDDGNVKYCDMNDEEYEDYIGCRDMIGGFQKIYPELFVLVGEVIGAIISESLPINVQNSFGNWLQLIGQVILTYNAQQQYFQGGPGHYFRPEYYNVTNTFCENAEEYKQDGEVKEGYRKSSGNKNNTKNIEKEIRYLKNQILKLQIEINNIKNND